MQEYGRYARIVYKRVAYLLFLSLAVAVSLPAAFELNKSMTEKDSTFMTDSVSLKLRFGSFDPVSQIPNFAPSLPTLQPSASQASLYIVQFRSPILATWRNQLIKMGVRLYDYFPDFAYLVQMNDTTAQSIAALPQVRWVGLFQPGYKLDASLLGKSGSLNLVVQTVGDASTSAITGALGATGALVQSSNATVVGANNPFIGYQHFNVSANMSSIRQIAALTTVVWIEEKEVFTTTNDKAAGIVQGGEPEKYKIWQTGITGAGSKPSSTATVGTEQIVAIADTGLDVGHDDFGGKTYPNATVLGITNWGAKYGSPDKIGVDSGAHGSHVSGTVAGSGAASGGKAPYDNGSMKGVAYGARIYMQQLGPSLEFLNGGPSNPVTQLLQEARNKGARIQTNSWGSNAAGAYTTTSREVDQFMWSNKDFLTLYSAGNSGPSKGSIGAPATAKNSIAVGGIMNGSAYSSIYNYSSRGPTNDGRVKPDLLAPASCLTSVKSGTKNEYVCYSGTSMAAPTAAGTAALVRDWYINKLSYANPQAALVKATLINASDYMTSVGGNLPQMDQGWGRIWLEKIMLPPDGVTFNFVDETKGVETGDSKTYTFDVTASSAALNLTLAWTDAPAANSASVQLVNDLDLTITAPDGTVYYGNNFSSQFSSKGNKADRLNNVEGISIQNPTTGKWKVTVKGWNVPNGPQPFALVARGTMKSTTAAVKTAPKLLQ